MGPEGPLINFIFRIVLEIFVFGIVKIFQIQILIVEDVVVIVVVDWHSVNV